MNDRLQDLLRPGEQVLFQAERTWVPNAWLSEPAIYAVALGCVWAAGLLTASDAGFVALAAALSGPWLHWLWVLVRDWSREGLVSDHRLLFRSGWFQPKLLEIDAAEVATIKLSKDQLRVADRNGQEMSFGHPAEAWALGGALAKAAGLALPDLPTRKDLVADWSFSTITITFWLTITVWPLTELYAFLAPASVLGKASLFFAMFLLAQFLLIPVMSLASLANVVLLRAFFSAAETHAWIDRSYIFWPCPGCPHDLNADGLRCRSLAHQLY